MKQFGFAPMKRTSVNIYESDKSAWQQLCADSPEFRACLSCGACAAACPINAATSGGLSVRKTLIELNRGIDTKAQIDDCQMCNRCALVCPRGLNTRKVNFFLARCKQRASI